MFRHHGSLLGLQCEGSTNVLMGTTFSVLGQAMDFRNEQLCSVVSGLLGVLEGEQYKL